MNSENEWNRNGENEVHSTFTKNKLESNKLIEWIVQCKSEWNIYNFPPNIHYDLTHKKKLQKEKTRQKY